MTTKQAATSTDESPTWWALIRVAVALTVGVAACIILAPLVGIELAAALAWISAALTYIVWVWAIVGRMDAAQTKTHAVREDPSRTISDLLVVVAAIASVAGVVGLLVASSTSQGSQRVLLAASAVGSVVVSWMMVHTVFALRYAAIHYGDGGGAVDFNGDEPRYSDFAYLAFTIGMTYQVSDTSIAGSRLRATTLQHALVSFMIGAVVLATVINVIAGLAG